MAAFMGTDVRQFIERYCYLLFRKVVSADGNVSFEAWDLCLRKDADGCVLLRENKCTVHEAKPLICSAFPFVGTLDFVRYCRSKQHFCEGLDDLKRARHV
jgi:Fe-S-cluster containining protein